MRSKTSTKCVSSTAGSHSCLSSGVVRTAFQGSKDICSSPVGISNTILKTSSPPLVEFRCTMTSVSSGTDDTRAFPFCFDEEPSREFESRFHSEAGEVRSCRKCASASLSAVYHDCLNLTNIQNPVSNTPQRYKFRKTHTLTHPTYYSPMVV